MDKIKNQIKLKNDTYRLLQKELNSIKNEIDELTEKMYIQCDHKFKYIKINGGQYSEYEYVCEKCGYSTNYSV